MIEITTDRNIFQLLERGLRERNIKLGSCLDVGCGMNPVDEWFRKHAGSPDAPYTAMDAHPSVKEGLKSRGIQVITPWDMPVNFQSDLVLAAEVIEHVKREDIPTFVSSLNKWTGKVLALTCPNFADFDVNSKLAKNKELRFVPDHLPGFDAQSNDPSFHKTDTAPGMLLEYLQKGFPTPEWTVTVYKAWPWLLSDIPAGRSFLVYFKLFALIWRN